MSAEVLSSGQVKPSVGKRSEYAARNPLMTIVSAIASLRLTVGLLILAVVVTFIGTLEQTRADIHTVKSKYFLENRVLVNVPLEVFVVPSWFPSAPKIPGSIWVPSGMTILILMIINLLAAHLIRFRLQAKGMKLAWGLLIAVAAGAFTWLIIFNAQNPGGLQGEPPIPWESMWVALQIVVLGIACGGAFGFFSLDRERRYERFFMALVALIAGGALLLTLLLPNKGFIGDSAMRIVWQLAQATAAASISLVACMMLFRRKGGMVLLHLGVLGLIANELYVNSTNNEQRMTFFEGETSNRAVDIRYVELAVIDVSDPEMDQIIVIPGSQLRQNQKISSQHLPFDIKPIEFFENSTIEVAASGVLNPATRGTGLRAAVKAIAPVSGLESRRRNIASAYIELFEKNSDKSLGTFLVSEYLNQPEIIADSPGLNRENGEAKGKFFALELRLKTEYKPYTVTLVDTTAQYYPGTQTPKHFSSDIVFNDRSNETTFEKKIWMNNPMRYAGETFYQTNYEVDRSGKEISTLQVVTNRGWMIPYVCCMFTVLGLSIQFGSTFLSYLEKRAKSSSPAFKSTPPPPDRFSASPPGQVPPSVAMPKVTTANFRNDSPEVSAIVAWLPGAVATGIFALIVLGQAVSAYTGKVKMNDMRLDLLGQIPVTKNGRVQPLDSVARHAALQMSKRENVNDSQDRSQPAIRWLADTMFGAEGYDEYRIFRVENAEVATALNLPFPMPTPKRHQKSNLKYTLAELLQNRSKMREMLTGDQESWNAMQNKMAQLGSLMNQALTLELTLGNPRVAKMSLLQRLDLADMNASNDSLPLIVPTKDPQHPWISFVALEDQIWLNELCEKYKVQTTQELAEAIAPLVQQEFLPIQREQLIKKRVIDKIVNSPELVELLTKEMGNVSKSQLRQMLENRWSQIPNERTETLRAIEGPFVDEILKTQLPQLMSLIEQQIAKVNRGSGAIKSNLESHARQLSELRPAYLKGDAETFNRVLTDYLAHIKAHPPRGMKPYSVATESWYNRFAPFYWAATIYLAVTVVAMLSWLVWPQPLTRAAGWMLSLGVAVHLVGLVARIVVSGRPPVTNLYSSFLFVAAAFAIKMLILERLTKMQIGYFLAGLGGFLGLLAAWNLTITDGDTFSVLVAVLDTQFWLATHVVTISLGYGATMVAGFLGMAYVIKGLFTSSLDKTSRRKLGGMIYGTACFGLLTSFFGTVLGGLWGDDSWGRFWGWDPKENGALMIVLWNAVILHARWGGIVKERGMAVLAILGNIITLWSWKGVNVLGVGLHAYAGTEDKALFYMLIFGLVALAIAIVGLAPTKSWKSYAVD